MNKRGIKLDKYGISKKRYKELCGFCEQYPEWCRAVKEVSFIKGVSYDPSPKSITNAVSSPVEVAAIKNELMLSKINLIETVAKDVDKEYWKQMLDVICYKAPLGYMIDVGGLRMSRSAFYERRRYFFYLLDQKKETI